MKVLLFLATFATSMASTSISGDTEAIIKVVQSFSEAGDKQNSKQLAALTSPDYRIVMNQLFGSEEISIMDRDTYLKMIEDGKFGGDQRRVEIKSIVISGLNAVVEVDFLGKAMNVKSTLNLSKTAKGKWLITSDTPTVI